MGAEVTYSDGRVTIGGKEVKPADNVRGQPPSHLVARLEYRGLTMGMDVHGIGNPDAYFRRSIWSWRPLADYVVFAAPDITQHCANWQSNDGDGLDAAQSLALADRLELQLQSGQTAAYVARRDAELARLPNEECRICGGAGKRLPPPDVGPCDQPCNGCDGVGSVRPYEAWYSLSVDDVVEFAAFLRQCGGFEIH